VNNKMIITPKLKIDRFAQLQAGDLFIFVHKNGPCVALKVEDPANGGDTFIVPLGHLFPSHIAGPTLLHPEGVTVIAFEKNYVLRLPAHPAGWLTDEPPAETHCFVVTDSGVYLRVNWSLPGHSSRACYVDTSTGQIFSNGHEYLRPRGTPAYAVEWALLTDEKEPRVILSYPATP
jgi:hypothetical protein